MDEIINTLSPIERKIIPFLRDSVDEIVEKSRLDKTSVLRACKFLENKELIKVKQKARSEIDLGVNGVYYKKNHLPERRLLMVIEQNNHISFQEAKKKAKLSDNEFKVSLGVLKKKLLINVSNGKLSINASKDELVKKFPEEQLLEKLPASKEDLKPEEQFALDNLKSRKEIVEIKEIKEISIELTAKGEKLAGKQIKSDLIEEVTPKLIKEGVKNKKFRQYDLTAPVPKIYGGKKHFVNQAIEYGKKIWLEMGFEEVEGTLTETSFWNFDALFQPQDHPTREMHDTFFIKKGKGKLPQKKKVIELVKQAHEQGVNGSEGWGYDWDEEISQEVILRTHTTGLSARVLANLNKNELPKKYFWIGKVFRNETVDWSHGFEFYQTEGIVVDRNANFRHLLGYLREFYKKMGFEKIRFTPAYFPYTEPSVEVSVFHPERKVWLELGGAGIFRPEVVIPLLGENIPVLAWGQGFDRIITDYYKIKDLREMYANNIRVLREKKTWVK